MPELAFDVEIRHDLEDLVAQGVAAIVAATEAMSRELRETHLPAEAPKGATGALSDDWQEREQDPLTRIVFPGEDAWYAHIVARGRREVRPVRGRALQIGGDFAAHAGPASANPFHDRAVAALEQGADAILVAALSEAGIG